jgi:hypothetical protein
MLSRTKTKHADRQCKHTCMSSFADRVSWIHGIRFFSSPLQREMAEFAVGSSSEHVSNAAMNRLVAC